MLAPFASKNGDKGWKIDQQIKVFATKLDSSNLSPRIHMVL